MDNSTLGGPPIGLFINTNNSVYVAVKNQNMVQVWFEGSKTPVQNISSGLIKPNAVFVTTNGDIFIDNSYTNRRIDRWTPSATIGDPVMYVDLSCLEIFLNIYDDIYCSLSARHSILRKYSTDKANTTSIVAGNGTNGFTPYMLDGPHGIFVDTQLNLYVADSGNDRIQFFRDGEKNGTTLAGNGASGTFQLSNPAAVVLDVDGNLFIADRDYNRIVGSFGHVFRCIAGCLTPRGSASNQLNSPRRLAFDSYGNLFVSDAGNSRVQKFLLSVNACGKC